MIAMSNIRKFSTTRLVRFMNAHGITFNIRIEGHGEAFKVGEGETPSFTMVFTGLLTYCIFAMSPNLLTFAKLYIDGHVDAEGDWFAFAKVIDKIADKSPSFLEKILGHLAKTLKINIHYGWSPEAFACFLDEMYMQYTSGRHGNTLQESQLDKLKFIAHHLKPEKGQRHLDGGCGWGGLIRYFTEEWDTVSHGVTVASEQAAYARKLAPQGQFFVSDFAGYTPHELYDCATIVGMVEHIPIDRHPEFFRWLSYRLRKGGRAYLQCITRLPTRKVTIRTHLLSMFVFDHELTTVMNLIRLIQKNGFEVKMVEEGHEDYAFTTRQWIEFIRSREAEIKRHLKDDRVYRVLLGYLTMAHLVMADNRCNLHRLVLIKK